VREQIKVLYSEVSNQMNFNKAELKLFPSIVEPVELTDDVCVVFALVYLLYASFQIESCRIMLLAISTVSRKRTPAFILQPTFCPLFQRATLS